MDLLLSILPVVVLIIIVLALVVSNIVIVQQSRAYVVERLGAFRTVWNVGLHLKVPFIERVAKKVSLKEQVADFAPQPVATDPWGIKVNRVELKNIIPPKEIQNAMEKQMKAERERRESILQAEGQKQSQILVAEGEKQSAILKAEAAKEAAIKRAEGEKEARIMAAEAEAQAITRVQQALADSLKLLNESAPNDQVVKLKALEAMQKVADGKATKIIIPSELQGLAGLAASAKAVFESEEPKAE